MGEKEDEGSVHSERVGSRKQSIVEKEDTEDLKETDVNQLRKQSKASVHSEKVESRKHSRVSAHDLSEKDDEQEEVQDDKKVSSLSISSISHMVSSIKADTDD